MASIAIINTSPPYASTSAQESLDLAMVAGTFGQTVSLFFIDDGVFQLVNQQNAQLVGRKDFYKSLAALEFYDVEQLYVCEQSLNQRSISPEQLNTEVKILTPEALAQAITQHNHLLRF